MKISPTGEYLALTVDRGEQDVLTVLRTRDLGIVKINQLPNDKSVGAFHWVSPQRLMFNSVRKFGRFAQPFSTGEWYSVNADGSMPRFLEMGKKGARDLQNARFSMLDSPQNDDGKVLMSAIYPRSSEGVNTEVAEVDTLNGRWKSLARAPRENCGMALDAQKMPRYAVCSDYKNEAGDFDQVTELYRREANGEWALVNSSKSSGKSLEVFGSARDGRIYATESDGKATTTFGEIDPSTGVFKPLFRDPVSDPSGYIASVDGSEVVLGITTEAGAPQVTMIDNDHADAKLYASLAASFPDQFVNFASATRDGKQIIVQVYSDTNPGELYLFDRATNQARFLMQQRKWIDGKRMASMKPIALTTRDGLKIHGYLTVPNGSDGKHLPMIVNVHGGPMGPRDNWGFNWETQLFASRGYAVLQINYRGSGGFGKGFQDMGYGTWATGIMNDIVDATKWTIAQGYADKDRVCIYGGSFGGYASMMAPAREQGLFKCAFGYVGAYDAEVQMTRSDTSRSESGRMYMQRALGKTRAERDAMSPVNHAGKINIPVYLAAGARDPRCPPENTEAMNKALIAAGNPPEGMMITSGEMHGFYKDENKLKLYTEMLDFFARHIGTRHVDDKPAVAGGSAKAGK
ncbi:MAG: S9 family peptidase [Xanthomonadales bacterium]|nr:S9 family peptidase [Xanthomonadales bacterium]